MKTLTRLAATLVLFTVALPCAAQSTLWVVDDDGGAGVDFTEIMAAVQAASEGDSILVKDGKYASVTIIGKSLSIVADAGAVVSLEDSVNGIGTLEIRDLAAGQTVSVRGLDAPEGSQGIVMAPGLKVVDCVGPVFVQDGHFAATDVGHPAGTTEGIRITESASVTLVDCTWEGEIEPGLVARNSSVRLYHCEGDGPADLIFSLQRTAAWIAGGELLAVGCEFRGADGLTGHGAVLSDRDPRFPFVTVSIPVATFLDCSFVPAPGAQDVLVEAGSFSTIEEPATDFHLTSPVREGGAVVETYTAPAGSLVYLAFSGALAPGFAIPAWDGAVHVGSPSFLRLRGLVPASGTLVKTIPIGELGPGLELVTLFEQPFYVDLSTLGIQAGPPSTVHLVDAAF